MALLTSCPACATRFKVVPDQLRLHHGLVRCGACDNVFDANTRLEAIVDAPVSDSDINDSSSPEAWYNKPAAQALADTNGQHKSANDSMQWTQMQPSGLGKNVVASPPTKLKRRSGKHISKGVMSSQNSGGEVTLIRSGSHREVGDVIGRFDDSDRYRGVGVEDLVALQASAQQADRRKRRAEKNRLQTQAALDAQASLALDGKSNDTHRNASLSGEDTKIKTDAASNAALWRTVRHWFTIIMSVLAGLAAIAQALLLGRFAIADALPVTKPLLSQACNYASCTVEPAPWLQPLSLDALTLSKPSGALVNSNINGLQTYRMQATVRNNSQLIIKKPDIELTISNAQGTMIARKTLVASSFTSSPPASTIKPSADWVIDSVLLLDEQTVGYTARVVYLP